MTNWMEGINRTFYKKSTEIDKLKHTVDSIDQKQREATVRIVGIPEEDGENLEKKVLKLAKNSLGLKKMKATDVKSIHRSGKKKETKCRDVIVQFANKEIKDNFQKEKKKLSTCDNPQKRIFINDDLTEYRQKLLYDARQLAKRLRLKAAWSQYGNIMVLKKDNGLKAISNYEDLQVASGMYPMEDPEYEDDVESSIDIEQLSGNTLLSSDY